MSSPSVVLIADDLTGSLDAIAPFAALGMGCVVAVSLDDLGPALALAPGVLSVNLGTRELPPDQARSRAIAATQVLKAATGPETFWIKKIDSRLKGPIAAEVSGMASVLPMDRMLICPAIPGLGRIVRQGHLQGTGVVQALPVAEVVGLDLPCDVPDALADADLDLLAASLSPGVPFAAALGLAAALARRLCPGRPPATPRLRPGPIGFAVGSRDPVTLAQVAGLVQAGGMRVVKAPDGAVPAPAGQGSFLIQATAGPGAEEAQVSARLAAGVVGYMPGLRTLVLTGGETAAAVLRAGGIGLLRVAGEVLPGLPLCHAVGPPGLPELITKSGGFGPPDTLLRLWQAAQRPEGIP